MKNIALVKLIVEICCDRMLIVENARVTFPDTSSVIVECYPGHSLEGTGDKSATYSCTNSADWLSNNNSPRCIRELCIITAYIKMCYSNYGMLTSELRSHLLGNPNDGYMRLYASNYDWLFITQLRVLLADWLILKIMGRQLNTLTYPLIQLSVFMPLKLIYPKKSSLQFELLNFSVTLRLLLTDCWFCAPEAKYTTNRLSG